MQHSRQLPVYLSSYGYQISETLNYHPAYPESWRKEHRINSHAEAAPIMRQLCSVRSRLQHSSRVLKCSMSTWISEPWLPNVLYSLAPTRQSAFTSNAVQHLAMVPTLCFLLTLKETTNEDGLSSIQECACRQWFKQALVVHYTTAQLFQLVLQNQHEMAKSSSARMSVCSYAMGATVCLYWVISDVASGNLEIDFWPSMKKNYTSRARSAELRSL